MCFSFYSYKLFDVERAELYLCVLRQLAVMYSSLPQHRSKMQQIYFPKLVKHSLKVLQEPSQQVQTFKPHNFAGFKKKTKNCLFLGYSTLTLFLFLFFIARFSLWQIRWLEQLLWHPWLWYVVLWSRT